MSGKSSFINSSRENLGVSRNVLTAKEKRLQLSVARSELYLQYQPILCLRSGCVTGVEALVRWQHPTRGLLLPGQILPLMERTQQILTIDHWVLNQVFQQLKEWQSWPVPKSNIVVSINLSGAHFEDLCFLEALERILSENQANPQLIRLEISDNAIIHDFQNTVRIFQRIKQMGFHLYLDDFGTGCSSLENLLELPVDGIKIDRSFIQRMRTDKRYAESVQILICLSHKLGKTVIAEGIETIEDLQSLREMQCDMGQGFLFSPAVNPSDLQPFFDEVYDHQASGWQKPPGVEGFSISLEASRQALSAVRCLVIRSQIEINEVR